VQTGSQALADTMAEPDLKLWGNLRWRVLVHASVFEKGSVSGQLFTSTLPVRSGWRLSGLESFNLFYQQVLDSAGTFYFLTET